MNKWDSIFNSEDYVYGIEPNDFLAQHAHLIPKGKVLCIADGEGRNSVHLASLGYEVISLDYSKLGLDKGQKLAAQKGVRIQPLLADLADYTFPTETFTGIVSIFCQLPQPLRSRVYSQVAPALKPGGTLILEAYTPSQLKNSSGGPPVEERLIPLSSLLADLDGLDMQLAHEIDRDVVEGRLHTGKASVLQIIATKEKSTIL